jgi:hypothetical protein
MRCILCHLTSMVHLTFLRCHSIAGMGQGLKTKQTSLEAQKAYYG